VIKSNGSFEGLTGVGYRVRIITTEISAEGCEIALIPFNQDSLESISGDVSIAFSGAFFNSDFAFLFNLILFLLLSSFKGFLSCLLSFSTTSLSILSLGSSSIS